MLASLVSTVALLAASALAISVKVPTTIAQCSKLQIIATGEPPLNVAVLHADDECGAAVKEWLGVGQGTYNHTVKVPVGTKLSILNEQEKGTDEEWATVTVVAGTTDCIDGASSSGSASAAFAPGGTATNGFASPSQSADGGAKNVGTDPTDETVDGASALGVSATLVALAVGVAALF